MELLILGGSIVTMGPMGVIRDGAVVVEGGRIVDVGKASELVGRYPRYERLDARNCVVIPGLVNAHQHIAMGLLRGYADDYPLKVWLEEWIWPLESKLTGRDIYVGALLTALESLMGGVTTINTMYHYADDWNEARALADAGLRGVVGHVCFSWRRDEDLSAIQSLAQRWHGGAGGRIRVSVDPHAPYTVDPEYMKELRAVADELNERYEGEAPITLHIHLAETADEAKRVEEAFGVRLEGGVVEYLDGLGVLGSDVVAAHCVHLTEGDIKALASRGVKVVHNPVSNLKLASGISPVPKLLEAGVTVALGTDGPCSNNSADMFETMKVAALLHKGVSGDPTVLSASRVLRMATIDGARALLWEDAIGSIEVGKRADIVILSFRKPHLTPLYHEESHLVYAAKSSDVETVIVDGEIVMENREVKTVNAEEVMRMARKAKEDILSRLEQERTQA